MQLFLKSIWLQYTYSEKNHIKPMSREKFFEKCFRFLQSTCHEKDRVSLPTCKSYHGSPFHKFLNSFLSACKIKNVNSSVKHNILHMPLFIYAFWHLIPGSGSNRMTLLCYLLLSVWQYWTAYRFQKKPCSSLPLYALFPLPVSSPLRSLTNFLHLKTLNSNTIFLCSIELDIPRKI